MKNNQITLAKLLTYSGTIPFIASLFFMQYSLHGMQTSMIVISYSTVIISFICGIHWAIYLFFAEQCSSNLLITSNAVVLLAWISLLITYQALIPLLHVVCFLYLFTLDAKLHNVSILPRWFYTLRRNATIIVVTCLIIMSKLI